MASLAPYQPVRMFFENSSSGKFQLMESVILCICVPFSSIEGGVASKLVNPC